MSAGDEYEREMINGGTKKYGAGNNNKLPEESAPGNGVRPRHLVEKVEFTPVSAEREQGEKYGIGIFSGVKLKVSGELGKTIIRVRDLIGLNKGSMLKLDRLADENLTLLVNEAPFAYGEVVVINDRYGVRVTTFLDEDSRGSN